MTSIAHNSGRRAGATWVAGLGAFLLLAGAATFVAVRWDRLTAAGKLGLVVAATAACLAGGRALARTLPATGDVVFHLGALLVLVDVAAVAGHLDAGWAPTALAEGVTGVAVLGTLARAAHSRVLAWFATAAMLVLAVGVAGLTAVPAPVVLLAAGVGAELARHRWSGRAVGDAALVWTALAGLSTAVVAAAGALAASTEPLAPAPVLAGIGVTGASGAWASALCGVGAAVVLARRARAAADLRLAALALTSAVVGCVSGLVAADLGAPANVVGLAAGFLLLELGALWLRADPVWHRPLGALATMAEGLVGASTTVLGLFLVALPAWLPLVDDRPAAMPTIALAAALSGAAWLVGDLRRRPAGAGPATGPASALALWRGGGWWLGAPAVALSAAGAVALATFSGPATALAVLTVAALAVAARRPLAAGVAAAAGPWAVAAALDPAPAATVAVLGACVIGTEAVRRARASSHAVPVEATVLVVLAAATLLAGAGAIGPAIGAGAAIAVAVAVTWALGLALDLAGEPRLGHAARWCLLVPAALVVPGPDNAVADFTQAAPALVALTALLVTDAVRLRRPRIAVGAALAVQPLLLVVLDLAGVAAPYGGLALCVTAVVWVGLAALADARWREPLVVAAVAGVALGLALATGDARAEGHALVVVGATGLLAGLTARSVVLAHVGGAAVALGLGEHLSLEGATAVEPYLLVPTLHLLVAGLVARHRRRLPSWIAYGPAVALLGGAALAERIAGGPGWHALVAGAVGMVAVIAGGWRRLAGPLVLGTVLVVAVTIWESLATLAGIPTWAWLVTGGSVLLVAGVTLERADTSPVEAGRRLVDVVAERFE